METFSIFTKPNTFEPIMKIHLGFKFKVVSWPTVTCEIAAVREDKNEIDIIITPSDGNAWQDTWKLDDMIAKCRDKSYCMSNEISFGI